MRVSFGLKVAIAIAFVSLLASTVAIVYFYLLIESNVWAEMSRRLRDIGKTGVALITAEQREDLIRLDRMLAERQAGVDESFLAEIEDGGYAEPIPEEDAAKLGQTREFLEVAQILRLIKAGTLKESIYPEPLDQLLNRPDQKATLKYAYLLAPIKESPDFQVVRFLGDADYEEIDMNGNGKIDDDEEGVPPGLLYRISDQPEMLRAFREGVVTNTLEPTPDAWGVWYSGMVPIKDANGKVIAVLGVDMDVNSELNLLKKFRWAAATSLIIIFFATLISAYLIARFLANPILKLREAAEKVQDRDFSVQVRVRGGDELGQLADGFNAMVREIRIYSDQMEDLVAERTARLEESLRQVQELKDRQDGDYYLSTLLTNPLFKNRNKSENVSTEFLLRQKKQFQFKKWKAELGGDLCVSGNIRFNGSRWIMFFNGDAMGKSMQGAGGALVMGSLINSIMVRSSANDRDLKIPPRQWMTETYSEIQRIFETFDGSMFVSGVLGIIEESTGKMFYLNAEHPHTVLFRRGEAAFLEEEISTRKFGMPVPEEPTVFEFQLEQGDVLIAGSDGRDDLVISSNTEGRVINQDENKFLEVCKRGNGDLDLILADLQRQGELTDDLSLIRIGYHSVPARRSEPVDMEQIVRQVKSGNYRRALELMDSSDAPDSTLSLYYRGLCMWKLGESHQALEYLEQAQQELANHGSMLRLLARVYFDLGDLAKATEQARRAMEVDPEDLRAGQLLEKIRANLEQ